MNKCFFLGKVLSNFEFEEFSKTCRIIFYLNIEEKRKTKSGKSKTMSNILALQGARQKIPPPTVMILVFNYIKEILIILVILNFQDTRTMNLQKQIQYFLKMD